MKKLLILLFFPFFILNAQTGGTEKKSSIGVNFGGSYLISKIDKNYLSNYNLNKFESAYSGTQFNLGLSYDYPLTDFITIGLNLNTSNSLFEIRYDVYGTMLNINGDSVNIKFNHELNYTFSKVSMTPFISVEPLEHLFFNLFFENNFLFDSKLIFNKIYEGSNQYVFPENSLNDYTLYSGMIEGSRNYTASLGVGIGYEIILSEDKSLSLTSSMNISFPLNSELENYDWLTTRMGLNLNLRYYISPSKSYDVNYTELFRTDTIIIKKPYTVEQFKKGKTFYSTEIDTIDNMINYTRIASRTDTLIQEMKNLPRELFISDSLIVKKQIIYNYYPLIKDFYFNFNSAKIIEPKNIKPQNNLIKNIFNYSSNSIDTIANRLKQSPHARILIRAYKDSYEKADCSITLERSKILKEIFTKKFKLDEKQIQIDTNLNDCTAENINNIKILNSKAELISIFSDIIAPIIINEFKYDMSMPLKITINGDSINIFPVIDKSKIKFLSSNPNIKINPIPKSLFETSSQIPLEVSYKGNILPQTINLNIQTTNIHRINFLTFDAKKTSLDPMTLKQLEIICSKINDKSKIKLKAYSLDFQTEDILNKRIDYLILKLQELLPKAIFEKNEIIEMGKINNPYLLNFVNTLLLEIEVN